MRMEFRPDVSHYIACYLGRERSYRIVSGLALLGINAQSVEGGMKRISTLSTPEVHKIIPPTESIATLIWGSADGREVKIATEKARDVLLNAGVHNRIYRYDDFMCYFYGKGVSLDVFT